MCSRTGCYRDYSSCAIWNGSLTGRTSKALIQESLHEITLFYNVNERMKRSALLGRSTTLKSGIKVAVASSFQLPNVHQKHSTTGTPFAFLFGRNKLTWDTSLDMGTKSTKSWSSQVSQE